MDVAPQKHWFGNQSQQRMCSWEPQSPSNWGASSPLSTVSFMKGREQSARHASPACAMPPRGSLPSLSTSNAEGLGPAWSSRNSSERQEAVQAHGNWCDLNSWVWILLTCSGHPPRGSPTNPTGWPAAYRTSTNQAVHTPRTRCASLWLALYKTQRTAHHVPPPVALPPHENSTEVSLSGADLMANLTAG